jgi:hypothetical protein
MRIYASKDLNVNSNVYVGSAGEVTVNPNTLVVRVHDGLTPGGFAIGSGSGTDGATGSNGATGATGSNGATGATGSNGATGATGAASTVTGPTGAASTVTGATGAASTVTGPTGAASTVTGPTGAASTVTGPTGAASTGPTGYTGPAPTVNATSTQVIYTDNSGQLVGNTNITFNTTTLTVSGNAATSPSTGAIVVAGGVGISGNVFVGNNVTVYGILKLEQSAEAVTAYSTSITSGGTVAFDCSNGQVFFITSTVAGNWIANLTNLSLVTGTATNITMVVVQGATPYIPSTLQIGGVVQTIYWQGGSVPTGTASNRDVLSFSIINNSGTYTVLGQLVSFS